MNRNSDNNGNESYKLSETDFKFISNGFNGYEIHENELFDLYGGMKEILPHVDNRPYFALDKIDFLNRSVNYLLDSPYFIHSNEEDKLKINEILGDVQITLDGYAKKAYNGLEFKNFDGFEELRGDFKFINDTINIIKPHIDEKPYFSHKVLGMAKNDIQKLLNSPYCLHANDRDDILAEIGYLQCEVGMLMKKAYTKLEFEV